MILKGLRSLFGQNGAATRSGSNAVADLISRLNSISNGLGEYGEVAFGDDEAIKKTKANEMMSVISSIEVEGDGSESADLHYALAIAYRNYCAWFARGVNRKAILEKVISNLERATFLDSANYQAKSELGRILIEEKVVRDRPKGLEMLKELKQNGLMPNHLNSVLAKARRQSGQLQINKKYNLCKFTDPSPAVFREERKRFRALIRKCKKDNKDEEIKVVLDQYYSLAVLVSLCYGDHDCSSAVAGRDYDMAASIVKQNCKRINYSFLSSGYLENNGFISKNDWKTFVSVFGESGNRFNPRNELL